MANADPYAAQSRDDKLSKALNSVLRHTGRRDGLYFTRGGFARLQDILDLKLLRMNVAEKEIYAVTSASIDYNGHPRFEIHPGPDQQDWIRSKSRHTIPGICASLPAEISRKDVEEAKACRKRLAGRDYREQEVVDTHEKAKPASGLSSTVGRASCDFNGRGFAGESTGEAWGSQPYLTLQRGEYVICVRRGQDGWSWARDLLGDEGWFPNAFFEPLQTHVSELEESGPHWEDHTQAARPAASSTAPASTAPVTRAEASQP
ncbi:unnamed protein product [Symbiodinium natans]|uniref:2'-phosphotransferase n=1 Tax=Symbiodinium natans TaxID=878477 RepID=A0A812I989_9DINO|nr:unnamed protein product [Symbiodinium natans]